MAYGLKVSSCHPLTYSITWDGKTTTTTTIKERTNKDSTLEVNNTHFNDKWKK